ncbi:MAG: hypothetical protein SOR77_01970 [Peptoniphilus sp.]|uniref:hypothetical protein n=1 Tax=Peptoniphilus sp. TaxID=1971214 RepID=UPI002A74D4D5|nr:hypothetical protein [Peptoniphilus sp.]MDY2986381.1 hypothetical protein [Peptoniphilus sp.]
MRVTNLLELQKALETEGKEIEILNSISSPDTIKVKKGTKLIGRGEKIFLSFINTEGISLEGDNEIKNISIQTKPENRAIYLNSQDENLGTINIEDTTITGVVQLMTRGSNKNLKLNIKNMDIVSADARRFSEKPQKYGVNVYQGALTIYNYNSNKDSDIEVSIEGVSIGRENAPAIGSGIFISGFNDDGGKVLVKKLVTEDIFSNGMIPFGQPNLITGGIFILNGAYAEEIISNGTVETYGVNDMGLDVWGKVSRWIVNDKIKSYGPSGIGFVNFGEVEYFETNDSIETYGLGARGFNQYDGTIKEAYFDSIKTVGDGSIGMQFSKPVGKIVIKKDVTTKGSSGETLVKGVIMNLFADGISVKEGGEIEELIVKGNIETNGSDVVSYHLDGGFVKSFSIDGEIEAKGKGAKTVVIENGGKTDTENLKKYID